MLFGCGAQTYILKNNPDNNKKEYVVVLHGLFVNSFYMHSLARVLAEDGYEVINISYPSTKHTLEDLSKFVEQEIKKHVTHEERKVNFVGYSLGGVVLRTVLKNYHPQNMGRVVHIGTPNKGSEVADRYKDNKLFLWMFGPVIKQVVTNQEHVKHLFGPVDYELGIIASKKSYNRLFSKLFKNDHDGIVSVESAILEGAKESYIVDATHEFMPFNQDIINQTLSFIRDGHFAKKNNIIQLRDKLVLS